MPKISSIDPKKVRLAADRHRNDPAGDERRHKLFSCIIKYMSYGNRNITYAEMADYTGLGINQVKYHFNKLVYVGAIKLQEGGKDNG